VPHIVGMKSHSLHRELLRIGASGTLTLVPP